MSTPLYVTAINNTSDGTGATLTITIPSANISGTKHFLLMSFGSTVGTSLDSVTVNGSSSGVADVPTTPVALSWRYWCKYHISANYSGSDIVVVATFGQTGTWRGAVALYKDVDQVTPKDAIAHASGSNNAPNSGAVTSSDATELVVDVMASGSTATPSIGGGHTADFVSSAASVPRFAYGSTPGGSGPTMSWTIDDGFRGWGIWAFALNYGGAAGPAISGLSSSNYTNGQTNITITGTGFGASQGAGNVKISPTDNVADGSAVTQTITSWGDTSITFTAVRGSLSLLTNLYLFVIDNSSNSNANGSVVQFYTPIALMGQAVF
jgi:hypothetical protein